VIFVLDGAHLAEQGTHEELMACGAGGLYARMVRQQERRDEEEIGFAASAAGVVRAAVG
jgi:ABC-type transport system involved in cytochrome bd biosynthesis fused ATPase/permease subunit